jgi:hypothetical protein
MTKSAIATTRKKPTTPAERRLRELDPDLAQLLDDMDTRLRAEQQREQNEQDAHNPINWQPVQEELDAERARLFLAGGAMIDAIMSIGELSVHVARQAAGLEAAEMMAQAGLRMPQHPRALLPPPDASDDPWAAEAGRLREDEDDSDDDDTTDDTDPLRVIHENAPPPPDEAETVEIAKAVAERPRASSGRGWRWWARIGVVAYTVSATLTGLALIGVTLTEWAIS